MFGSDLLKLKTTFTENVPMLINLDRKMQDPRKARKQLTK